MSLAKQMKATTDSRTKAAFIEAQRERARQLLAEADAAAAAMATGEVEF